MASHFSKSGEKKDLDDISATWNSLQMPDYEQTWSYQDEPFITNSSSQLELILINDSLVFH